ncbi:MAG: phage minor head protein [Bacteroidia bacterium]
MCSFCDIENKVEQLHLFEEEYYDNLINAIYEGKINLRQLDVFTYNKIAGKLTEGVFKGFGVDIETTLYNSPDYKMLNELRKNVYVFSGAKVYQETRAVVSLLTDKDKITSFSDFKKQAKTVLADYNQNYLSAEYNSAISQSRSASQWMEIEKDKETLGMLTYNTVGDGRVRFEHAMLNGISRPVDDKWWDKFYPPNGWNCRCDVTQSDDAIKTDLRGFRTPDTVPKIFQFNAGKQRIVFSKKHPYFDIADRDKDFAKMNFNLPLP